MARTSRETGTIAAVERAFAVVRAVASSDSSAGVSALARATALPKSTVARLLTTLEALEVVERVDGAGGYQVGRGLSVLVDGPLPTSTLRDAALPFLREFVDEMGEDVGLAVADGRRVLYLEQLQSDAPVQVRDWSGERTPYHTVAAGLILMASWTERRLATYLARPLEKLAVGTVTNPHAIRSRLVMARESGYVWTFGEWADDINGVGAAIRDDDGRVVAALNAYGPTYRFPGERGEVELGELAADTADRISGYLATWFSR